MGEESTNPWDRLEGESTRAYAAFMAYLEMGTNRSIEKARLVQNRGKAGVSWWEEWSRQYHWVDRARAWDDFQFQRRLDSQQKILDEARMLAVEHTHEMIECLVAIAQGEAAEKENLPARVAAAKALLSIAGVSEKVVLEHSGPGGGPIPTEDKTPRAEPPSLDQAREILRILIQTGALEGLDGDGKADTPDQEAPDGSQPGDR